MWYVARSSKSSLPKKSGVLGSSASSATRRRSAMPSVSALYASPATCSPAEYRPSARARIRARAAREAARCSRSSVSWLSRSIIPPPREERRTTIRGPEADNTRFTGGLPSGYMWADVYLSAVARAISACGNLLAGTALVLTLQGRGAGGYAVAAVLIAAAAPPTLLAPWTGRLVDRVDSRLLLVSVSLVQTGICTVLAFTTGTVAIVVLVALLGCGTAVTGPTLAALLPEMVDRERLPRASAIGQTANSVGFLLAPALGGVLYGGYGMRVPLLLDAGTFLAITAAALFIRTRRGRPSESAAAERTGVFRDALLRPSLIMVGAVVTGVSAVNVADVFFVRETLHGSATAYGLLGAVWTGAMLVGAWLLTGRE